MRLYKHPAKLESKWEGPFKVLKVHSNGSLLLWSGGHPFKVNGHRCKKYYTWADDSSDCQYIGSVNLPEYIKYDSWNSEDSKLLDLNFIASSIASVDEGGYTIV